jgi:pimeloyl-ACP methyl ester carboxylesterase
VILDDPGHVPWLDAPDRYRPVLAEFVRHAVDAGPAGPG